MVMHEQDSDLVRWGLCLLDYEPYSHSGYQAEIIQHNSDGIYYGQYYRGHEDTEYNHVENDEIIARTLQEEFSQLAVTDAPEFSHAGEATVDILDWRSSPTREQSFAHHEHDRDEYDNVVPTSSCSSPSEGEEHSDHLKQIYENVLDSEVGKRLNQMISIPHVPRINGDIPSIDEATSDHERLLNRLQLYDFVELKVQGDGNCQFRSLSDQLHEDPDHHKYVRRQIVNQLKSHPEIYEGYVPMEYDDYVAKMSRSGEWGDHVTLQAAADSYGVKIFVITSFKDTCYIEILPKDQKIRNVIFLSFWAEVHYNSIYFQGALPSPESRKKKKWWMFGN